MNPLLDKLQELITSGTPVGFCPWDDGDGMLWGRLLSVTETKYRVQLIDPFGREEDIEEYELASTVYFDENPQYAQRLALLANFVPTLPEETDPIIDPTDISDVITKAFKSGEVIRMAMPGGEELDVTVGQMGFGWAEVSDYDDVMKPKGSQWVNIGQIEEITWRNGRAEADTYLLKL